MTRPASFEEAAALIPAYLRPGVKTNLASPDALRGEELALAETDGGLFILRRRPGFRLLTFLMNGSCLPELDGAVAAEAVFAPGADDGPLTDIFSAAGYALALRRVRLSRGPGDGGEASRAAPEEHPRIMEILRESFSPLTGCLPREGELMEDILSGRVLAARENGELVGVLRYRTVGKRAEIRHLAVDAPHRGHGLSGRLIDGFFHEARGLRLSVWTGEDNVPALAVYKSRGFEPDGRYSTVYVKGK